MHELFDKKIMDRVRDFLVKRGESIAVAESVTSGLLQLALASASDAMQFYQGGITTYNLGQKSRHLHVEPIHALSCHCVSPQVASEMALNVCTLFGSSWGIGVTGYASPVPESDNKLYCHYAIAHKSKIVLADKIVGQRNEPFKVQHKYAEILLADLARYLGRTK